MLRRDMPIYEYRCGKCGSNFELLVSGTTKQVSCPECSSVKVNRKFSAFAVRSGGRSAAREGSAVNGRSSCSSCGGGHCSHCH